MAQKDKNFVYRMHNEKEGLRIRLEPNQFADPDPARFWNIFITILLLINKI